MEHAGGHDADLQGFGLSVFSLSVFSNDDQLYDFPLSVTGEGNGPRVPAIRSSFSSYPASLFSGIAFPL
jgi:hypothetical protein